MGDFNGDGNLDPAFASSDNWGYMLGNGDGTFQKSINSDEIEGPSWITAGDFNGDGRSDLAAVSGEHATVNIYLNQPDGAGPVGQGHFNSSVIQANENLVTASIPLTRNDGIDNVVRLPDAARNGTVLRRQDDTIVHGPRTLTGGQSLAMSAGMIRGEPFSEMSDAVTLALTNSTGDPTFGLFNPVRFTIVC